MRRPTILTVAFFLALVCRYAVAHPAGQHEHEHEHAATIQLAQADPAAEPAPAPPAEAVSGQGDLKFKVLYTSAHLPAEAVAVLTKAHGGFAVDRREGRGQIYFALPGAGIIEISGDLASTRMIPTPGEMKDTNLHNAGIWYAGNDTPYLVFPGNEVGKVFTTTTTGELVNTLEAPGADFNFDEATVNAYFKGGGKFVPTDVAKLGRYYYITTGYSDLDYVLTAMVTPRTSEVKWNDLAFGGKGGPDDVGKFGTGHGVTISPDPSRVVIADRPHAQVDRFTRYGHYRDTVKLPEGSFPCDVDYVDDYMVVGCLHGPDRAKGAPVYIVKDDQVVSTIMPKEELGLANFTHIHNATMVNVGGKLYVIAQAWNPGDFAILEQVAN